MRSGGNFSLALTTGPSCAPKSKTCYDPASTLRIGAGGRAASLPDCSSCSGSRFLRSLDASAPPTRQFSSKLPLLVRVCYWLGSGLLGGDAVDTSERMARARRRLRRPVELVGD